MLDDRSNDDIAWGDFPSLPPGVAASSGSFKSAGCGGRLSTRALIGSDALHVDGRHLGCVEELILDPESGQLDYVVILVGRHGLRGATLVTVPWRAVMMDRSRHPRTIVVDADALNNAPSLQASSWPLLSDPAWAEEVHAHFSSGDADA